MADFYRIKCSSTRCAACNVAGALIAATPDAGDTVQARASLVLRFVPLTQNTVPLTLAARKEGRLFRECY